MALCGHAVGRPPLILSTRLAWRPSMPSSTDLTTECIAACFPAQVRGAAVALRHATREPSQGLRYSRSPLPPLRLPSFVLCLWAPGRVFSLPLFIVGAKIAGGLFGMKGCLASYLVLGGSPIGSVQGKWQATLKGLMAILYILYKLDCTLQLGWDETSAAFVLAESCWSWRFAWNQIKSLVVAMSGLSVTSPHSLPGLAVRSLISVVMVKICVGCSAAHIWW
mmetsp:Transcript_63620/g.175493  ORF Transcript_63620/g.175493 Transcript_63620/m.175493 type:complete len:222 (+) Transcript_63620:208-873(+)